MKASSRRWELFGCSLHGHVYVGTDAAEVTDADAPFVREVDGLRWHRCLRCDSWQPLPRPALASRDRVPAREEIDLPLRGRALRDRFVLRLIAVDRAVHVVVLAGIALALFVFASHHKSLEESYDDIMNGLLGSSGGPASLRGWLGHVRHVFFFSPQHLYELGIAASAYAALEASEMVGLWLSKRWAEYLTFVATCLLLPLEIYELSTKLSVLKIVVFILNLAVAVYLLLAKRLFGVRGGHAAIQARKAEDSGWPAFDRATPLPREAISTTADPGPTSGAERAPTEPDPRRSVARSS
jgi:uncharacterized membrane protein (DUF2068 family)